MDAESPEQHDGQLQEPNEPGDIGEVHAAICSYGFWRCPTTNEHYDYESLACSHDYQFSKPKMQAVCTSHCPKPCQDSGWLP